MQCVGIYSIMYSDHESNLTAYTNILTIARIAKLKGRNNTHLNIFPIMESKNYNIFIQTILYTKYKVWSENTRMKTNRMLNCNSIYSSF